MKSKNRENLRTGLAAVISFLLPLMTVNCQAARTEENILVFEGTVEKLVPDLGILSGGVAVFRLAKYRVEKVCRGNYSGNEIVVDHLILNGNELQGVKVGDRLCVSVKRFNKIVTRYDAEGIRSPSDVVTTFFIAEEIKRHTQDAPCCSQ